ncbi:hypothetical protein IKF15_04500 [Candidatus Saccharibacteria bacterium]|nr:hypothetical protein [Candidatus Saccharibacteria bacterium]
MSDHIDYDELDKAVSEAIEARSNRAAKAPTPLRAPKIIKRPLSASPIPKALAAPAPHSRTTTRRSAPAPVAQRVSATPAKTTTTRRTAKPAAPKAPAKKPIPTRGIFMDFRPTNTPNPNVTTVRPTPKKPTTITHAAMPPLRRATPATASSMPPLRRSVSPKQAVVKRPLQTRPTTPITQQAASQNDYTPQPPHSTHATRQPQPLMPRPAYQPQTAPRATTPRPLTSLKARLSKTPQTTSQATTPPAKNTEPTSTSRKPQTYPSSPFIANTKVEKRPLGQNAPEIPTHQLKSTKNVYSQKDPTRVNPKVAKKHVVTETPKSHSGWLWAALVLLIIAAGGGLGYLAYLLVFAN